jgi:hypothetical protein
VSLSVAADLLIQTMELVYHWLNDVMSRRRIPRQHLSDSLHKFERFGLSKALTPDAGSTGKPRVLEAITTMLLERMCVFPSSCDKRLRRE